MAPLPRASISSETIDRGAVVVRLRGGVSVTNVAAVGTSIIDALGRPGSDVIVDLRDMTFIDSRVVRTFLLVLRQAEERRHAVAVVRPDPNVWRAFELSDLAGAFPNFADGVDAPGLPTADRIEARGRAARAIFDEDARRARRTGSGPSSRFALGPETAATAFGSHSDSPLTARERRVLFELARGSTTEDAAAAIGLSPHTVRSHLKSAARKLGATTRSHAVALAITQGAIVVDQRSAGRFARPPGELSDNTAPPPE